MDQDIEEKRIYGDREGALVAYVAGELGVVRVRIAGDAVGEFDLCDRCTARDVAATGETVVVATDEDVRLLSLSADDASPTAVEAGFGPAVAVGAHDGDVIAAGPDGDVARLSSASVADAADAEWTGLERDAVESVQAIDGDLVGTDAGVYRVHGDGLDHVGLTDVRDVAGAGVPLAATADGLYKLGNGWMRDLEGSFDVVAADPRTDRGRLSRAHAVAGDAVYAYDADADRWTEFGRSPEPIAGLAYGEALYAVTESGTFLTATPADDAGTWRSRTLGIRDVAGLAVSTAD